MNQSNNREADATDAVDVAIKAERRRCADIVKAARFGQIDSDLRSLIHRIETGDVVELQDE